MTTSARNSGTFEAIRRSLAESLPKGGEAWLYGSRARGDAREDSDWDVLILLDKERVTIEDDRDITLRLRLFGYESGQEINPQLFTRKEWESYAAMPFNHNVTRDRIRIS